MAKGYLMIIMVILNILVILLMVNMKEKENHFIQKENIIPGVGKKERKMAEVLYINQMGILNI